MQEEEFARRRQDLMARMGPGGIAIVPTAQPRARNRDVEYPFRPDSDFYYLTGFAEPDAVAVLIPGRDEGEFLLFCRPRDPQAETWTGRRAGLEGAIADYGADEAHPIANLDEVLPGLIAKAERVYYTMGIQADFDRRLIGWLNELRAQSRRGARTPDEVVALEHHLHEMRLFKSRAELKQMRRAAEVSAEGHRMAMIAARPGLREYQVEAELIYSFMRAGARAPAYPSIVAGGENACILHYTENNAPLEDGDLLLIDAGAELGGYAADITRTFPVNGRFSGAQRAVYEVVLAAQKAAVEAVQPGASWDDPHQTAVRHLTEGLKTLGLLSGDTDGLLEQEAYKRFFMHRTGHWLGLDVHDVGDYRVDGQWRDLEPGMVLTVEPGLYVPRGAEGVDERWWGIGVRIEDDVAVTRDGHLVLSDGAPKEIDALESLLRQ